MSVGFWVLAGVFLFAALVWLVVVLSQDRPEPSKHRADVEWWLR